MDPNQVLTALVQGDGAAMESLLKALSSIDNNQRNHAEEILEKLKAHPDACVSQLIRSLRSSPELQSRGLAAVLLRKVLTRSDKSLWPTITPQLKETVKSELLNCIKEEPMRSISHKVCDTIAELGAGILEDQGWDQLLPTLFNMCVPQTNPADEARLMESALLIFAELARYVIDVLTPHLAAIHGVLKTALAHPSIDVRGAAVAATSVLIQETQDASMRDGFQDTVPLLLAAIGQALNQGEEQAAQDATELFIEIAEEHPRFFKKQLNNVLDAFIQIAQGEGLEEATRSLAAELLITLCEARERAPGMMRKVPQFLERFFTVVMGFLLDIEDEAAWHTAEDEKDEEEGEGDLFHSGQDCLDRLALSLGGKTLVPLAGAVLPPFLTDADWKKRHAALICLAQIAEGCVKVMKQEEVMKQLVAMCLQGASDSHVKVRWASCQALGQLCTDLGPEFQETGHAAILPALMQLMEDVQNPRVQAHACAALVNFAENCEDQDVVAPYLDNIISRLIALLQQGKKNVQEGALTALASIADCSQEYFEKYYNAVMPLLKTILQQASNPTHRLLRGKAIECLSLIGLAVGKDKFANDAYEVMTFMQAVTSAGLDADDPLISYFQQAAGRICKVLEADFLPYLPIVMPSLLASAGAKPDITVRNLGEDDEEDLEGEENGEEEEDDVETFLLGGKRVSLKTSILDEKATACSMVCLFAADLKEGFFPYVEEVVKIMVPLLKFMFNEDIRAAAAQCIPELLNSSKLAARKSMGPDEQYVRNMAGYLWKPLLEALKVEPDPYVVTEMLVSLDELLEYAEGPAYLPVEAIVEEYFEALKEQLVDYDSRKEERMARTKTEDFDEEEAEALQEEHEAEEEILNNIATCVSTAMRLYGDAAMPALEEHIFQPASQLLDPKRFPEERRVALCIMDDVLEHSPAGTVKFAGNIMPLLIGGLADGDSNIRQCCVYGLGQAAEKRPDAFRPSAPAAVAGMLAMIQAPDAKGEDNINATENAVSALGKVLEFQPDCVDPSAGTLFITHLPLEEDEDEAKAAHKRLVKLVQQSDHRILGDNNANLPKIVSILVTVLGKGGDLVDDETQKQMVILLRQMQAALPADVFNGFVAQMKPKQIKRLEALLHA